MAESEGYADEAILELLGTVGPLTATAIAADLAVPVRTVRHRLMRLRENGIAYAVGRASYGGRSHGGGASRGYSQQRGRY